MSKIVYAKHKYSKSSAQKARLVIDLIRGKDVKEAETILKFTNKMIATDIQKVLKSAVSNAVNNGGFDQKDLVVVEAFVDEAPTFKRGKAVSKGRYFKILKRNCHITIGVEKK